MKFYSFSDFRNITVNYTPSDRFKNPKVVDLNFTCGSSYTTVLYSKLYGMYFAFVSLKRHINFVNNSRHQRLLYRFLARMFARFRNSCAFSSFFRFFFFSWNSISVFSKISISSFVRSSSTCSSSILGGS